MAKANLVKLANENVDLIELQFKKIINTSKFRNLLEDFINYLKDNLKVSVNAPHQKFLKIIETKSYLSSFEASNNYPESKKHYGSRRNYRNVIDNYFEQGKFFKYFALNSGNMGTPLWGPYCIVLDLKYFDENLSAILKKNSLDRGKAGYYYFTNEKLNEALFISELAILKKTNELCVIKLSFSIPKVDKNDWSELICKCKNIQTHDEANYIELITYQKCVLDSNYTIRMYKKRIAAVSRSSFKTIKPKGWDIMKDEFEDIKRLKVKYKFNLELI